MYLNSTFFKRIALFTLEIANGINVVNLLAYWAFVFP